MSAPRVIALLAGVLLPLGLPAAPLAPSADDLVQRYMEAHGGEARWKAIQSLEQTGTFTAFSVPAPFTILRKRPDLYRFDHVLNGHPVQIGFDGQTPWWKNEMVVEWAHEAPLAEAIVIRGDAELGGPLFDYRAKGHRIELVGREKLEGHDADKLKLTRKDGVVEYWYLDPSTHLEVARQSPGSDFGSPAEQWVWFSDFRKVDGIVVPHHVEIEFGTRHLVLETQALRANVPIDDTVFRMPLAEGMAELAALAGDWLVKVENRPDPRAEFKTSETTSKIEPLVRGNLLQEHVVYHDADGQRSEFVRTYSYDRFKKLYRLTLFDDFTTYQNVLEGKIEDGKLAATNKETATSWAGFGIPAIFARQVLYEISPGGFKLDSDLSFDAGESWSTFTRYTYTRK